MLPLRGDIPRRSAPIAVGTLMMLGALTFGFSLSLGPDEAALFFERYGLVPRELLRALAGGTTAQIVWVTPLSSMFLHGGLLHLAGNGLYLWIFGVQIEDLLGSARFLLFYFACGLAAVLVHVASASDSFVPTVGASGAISGLLGAYAVSYPTGRFLLLWPPVRVPAIAFLLVWIAFQIGSGLSLPGAGGAGVAWWAHVGGFAAGAALARSMWLRRPTRSRLRI